MRPIEGKARSVRELLQGAKYSIDFYQREYRWEAKQVHELIDDLTEMFLEEYEEGLPRRAVAQFPHYFLGSIIVSQRDGQSFIVDGQQRLTTLTLLLMSLRAMQGQGDDTVKLDDLIYSAQYGERTFNLAIDERTDCMEALFEGKPFDPADKSESVQNLYQRYQDIDDHFPDELRGEALPYFADWLIEHVHLIEITAYTDEEAYTIFETMNDRGLSLSPTEMLKGYLLANMEQRRRVTANDQWRARIQQLTAEHDDHGADFFKVWLRSRHAQSIRQRRKGAKAEDFERIGTEFHRWVRSRAERLGLKQADDFYNLVSTDVDFYSRQFLRVRSAEHHLTPGLEHIHYNAGHGFTLQELLLMAPLRTTDDPTAVDAKLNLVARFVDILLARRIWNFRSIAYSTMQYGMFLVAREIRELEPDQLATTLHQRLVDDQETSFGNARLRVHQQNRYAIHRLLARMTDYVETESGQRSRYAEYVATGRHRYEVEHIWANHPERHREEFPHAADFAEQRNRIGGLVLLPKSFNASYGDLPYEKKLPHYLEQNLLARSLHPQAYDRNPGFRRFIESSGLPFRSHQHFQQSDLHARSELYRLLAEQIWDPDQLLNEVDDKQDSAARS